MYFADTRPPPLPRIGLADIPYRDGQHGHNAGVLAYAVHLLRGGDWEVLMEVHRGAINEWARGHMIPLEPEISCCAYLEKHLDDVELLTMVMNLLRGAEHAPDVREFAEKTLEYTSHLRTRSDHRCWNLGLNVMKPWDWTGMHIW
jgi:hypothetical protein